MTTKDDGVLRGFDTGATRDTAEGKLAYNGFYSPFVMRQFARFMNMNRLQSDGKLRDANNWQKGIPMDVYRESLSRHYQEFWEEVEKKDKLGDMMSREGDIKLMAAACGMMFNIQGYVLEWLKKNPEVRFDDDEPTEEMADRQAKLNTKPVFVCNIKPEDLDDPFLHCEDCRFSEVNPNDHPCDCCEGQSNYSEK